MEKKRYINGPTKHKYFCEIYECDIHHIKEYNSFDDFLQDYAKYDSKDSILFRYDIDDYEEDTRELWLTLHFGNPYVEKNGLSHVKVSISNNDQLYDKIECYLEKKYKEYVEYLNSCAIELESDGSDLIGETIGLGDDDDIDLDHNLPYSYAMSRNNDNTHNITIVYALQRHGRDNYISNIRNLSDAELEACLDTVLKNINLNTLKNWEEIINLVNEKTQYISPETAAQTLLKGITLEESIKASQIEKEVCDEQGKEQINS